MKSVLFAGLLLIAFNPQGKADSTNFLADLLNADLAAIVECGFIKNSTWNVLVKETIADKGYEIKTGDKISITLPVGFASMVPESKIEALILFRKMPNSWELYYSSTNKILWVKKGIISFPISNNEVQLEASKANKYFKQIHSTYLYNFSTQTFAPKVNQNVINQAIITNPLIAEIERIDRYLIPETVFIEPLDSSFILPALIPYIDSGRVFTFSEQMPKYPSGNDSLYIFIKKHCVYPIPLKEAGNEGKVYIKFVVEKDGSISNVEILRSTHILFAKEASRLIKSMPNWIPAQSQNKAIRCQFILPITFKLN